MRTGLLAGVLGFHSLLAITSSEASTTCLTPPISPEALIEFGSYPVASFQDGKFQSSFATAAGNLSTAATAAATAYASGATGSVIVIHPNSSKSATTGSSDRTAANLSLTSAVLSINTTNIAPRGVAATAAQPVSPAR